MDDQKSTQYVESGGNKNVESGGNKNVDPDFVSLNSSLHRRIFETVFSIRTERSLRVTVFFIPILLLFYYEWLDMRFSYSCVLTFLLMTALCPSTVAGLALLAVLMHSVCLLSMALITSMCAVAVSSIESYRKGIILIIFLLYAISLSMLKVGPNAGLPSMASVFAIYLCVLAFFNVYPFILYGVDVHVLWSAVKNKTSMYPELVKILLEKFPSQVQKLLGSILNSPSGNIPDFPPLTLDVNVPNTATNLEPELSYVVGQPLRVILSPKDLNVVLLPGIGFVRLLWSAHKHLGILRSIYAYTAIAMAGYIGGLLLPPQRYTRSVLREKLNNLLHQSRNVLTIMVASNPLNFNSQKKPQSYLSASDKDLEGNLIKRADSSYEDKVIDAVRLTLGGKKGTLDLNSTVLHKRTTLLIPEILQCETLSSFAFLASAEPSLSNPGLFTWSAPHWNSILTHVEHLLIRCYSIQTLLKQTWVDESYQAKITMMKLLNISEAHSIQNDSSTMIYIWLENNTPLLRDFIQSALKLFHVAELLVSMHPVSRGSQRLVMCELQHMLETLSNNHKTMILQVAKVPFDCLTPSGSWDQNVMLFGAYYEIKKVMGDLSLDLSSSVNSMVTAHVNDFRVRNVLYNIAGVFTPAFALFYVYLSKILLLLMPWRWRWQESVPWAFTRLPWYRSPNVAFCLRWVLGVALFFTVPLFWEKYRIWTLVKSKPPILEGVHVELQSTKMTTWTALAFLTTINMTVEGTFHRSILRFLGMLVGSLFGYVCVKTFGLASRIPQIIWLLITTFLACWIGVNPEYPTMGFNASWGYACQLFMYQQAIIIVDAYSRIQETEELLVSRILAHVVGIFFSLFVTCIVFPNQCTKSVAFISIQVFRARMESLFIGLKAPSRTSNPTNIDDHMESQSMSRSALECSTVNKSVCETNEYTKGRSVRHLLSRMKLPQRNEKAQLYDDLISESMDILTYYSRDVIIFEQVGMFKTDQNLWATTDLLRTAAGRHRIFIKEYQQALGHCSVIFSLHVDQLLVALQDVVNWVETVLSKGNKGLTWFTGYGGMLTLLTNSRRRYTPSLNECNSGLKPLLDKVFDRWRVLGTVYFSKQHTFQPDENNTDSLLSFPNEEFAELFVSYTLWTYIQDICQYIGTLTQT